MFRSLCVMLLVAVSYAADAAVIDATASNGIVQGGRTLKLGAPAAYPAKKKSPPKKVPAKKSPPKKVPAKKSPPKKVPAKKSPPKTVPAKKSPPKTVPAKKSPPKQVPAMKSPPKTTAVGAKHLVMVGSGAGFSFGPNPLKCKVGDTITFKSMNMGHNVVFTKGPPGVDLTKLRNQEIFSAPIGYSFSIKIPTAGMYTYMCLPHAGAGMIATIEAT